MAVGALQKAMPRGGARNYKKPWVSEEVLYGVLASNVDLVKDLGSYESVMKSWAVDYGGLVMCENLVLAFLKVCPMCVVHDKALRKAVSKLLLLDPDVNQTKYRDDVWVNMRCERLGTLLNHVRAARDSALTAASMRLTGASLKKLKNILQKVDLSDALSKAEAETLAICDGDLDRVFPRFWRALRPARSERRLWMRAPGAS